MPPMTVIALSGTVENRMILIAASS